MSSFTELFTQDAPDAFDAVTPDKVLPAITNLIEAANIALERAVSPDVANDFDALSAVLDTAVERLSRAWGIVTHLNAVVNTPELRAAHAECLPLITEFHTRLGADARLFAKYKAIQADVGYERLSVAQRKSVSNALRDFTLSGAQLQGEDRTQYARNQEAQALLSRQFADHVLDATDGHVEWATEEEVEGLPADVRQAARDAAHAEGQEGYKLTLHIPSYLPVMQYANHRGLRERMYRAYITRASDIGKSDWDNSPVMRKLLELRAEQAKLLGHASYAELSLAPKMAASADEVLAFLRNLARHAKPRAVRELAELQDFALRELGLESLQAWDLPYASEKLKEAGFSFSSQTVRQYSWPDCLVSSRSCLTSASHRKTLRCGTRPFATMQFSGAANAWLASTWMPTPGRASVLALGWTVRARAGAARAVTCNCPWPTLCAISARPRWAGRPCSRTATSPPSSTSSAMGCTTS